MGREIFYTYSSLRSTDQCLFLNPANSIATRVTDAALRGPGDPLGADYKLRESPRSVKGRLVLFPQRYRACYSVIAVHYLVSICLPARLLLWSGARLARGWSYCPRRSS
jgi:hypothetical protein